MRVYALIVPILNRELTMTNRPTTIHALKQRLNSIENSAIEHPELVYFHSTNRRMLEECLAELLDVEERLVNLSLQSLGKVDSLDFPTFLKENTADEHTSYAIIKAAWQRLALVVAKIEVLEGAIAKTKADLGLMDAKASSNVTSVSADENNVAATQQNKRHFFSKMMQSFKKTGQKSSSPKISKAEAERAIIDDIGQTHAENKMNFEKKKHELLTKTQGIYP